MSCIEFELKCEVCGQSNWVWDYDKLRCANCGHMPFPYVMNGEKNYFLDEYAGKIIEIPHYKFTPESEIKWFKEEVIQYNVGKAQIEEYEKYMKKRKAGLLTDKYLAKEKAVLAK